MQNCQPGARGREHVVAYVHVQAAHCTLRHCAQNADLARFYVATMKSVARKSVLRM